MARKYIHELIVWPGFTHSLTSVFASHVNPGQSMSTWIYFLAIISSSISPQLHYFLSQRRHLISPYSRHFLAKVKSPCRHSEKSNPVPNRGNCDGGYACHAREMSVNV